MLATTSVWIGCTANMSAAIKATAVFFDEQTVDCLKEAIRHFDTLQFDPQFIKKHAEKFEEHLFIEQLQAFVKAKYNEWLGVVPLEEHKEVKISSVL